MIFGKVGQTAHGQWQNWTKNLVNALLLEEQSFLWVSYARQNSSQVGKNRNEVKEK